jgi:hypothetical protein
VSTTTLPRLLDRKALASELGVKLATAERIMRHCPKIAVGRRVYVTAEAVAAYLKSEARS